MRNTGLRIGRRLISIALLLFFAGCTGGHVNEESEAPPPAAVVPAADASLFTVDHPEQYPLLAATAKPGASQLVVTGVVTPDISRNVPVISLASGKVVGIFARLGDSVKKGQLLFRIRSDDVSGGYSNYRKAIADELLARAQLERTKDLYEHGAMAQADLEIAQDAEDKAKVDLETMSEHLRLLGNDPDKPNFMVEIHAPVDGVITDQQIADSAVVQAYSSPSPMTISDLSHIWIVCDVYENDLAGVRQGEAAEIRLNAYSDEVFKGTISNIGAILDPNIRTAKVRVEMGNPGMMRIGMFASATFHGRNEEMHTVVPASAVLHMHDRDFVYLGEPDHRFRRVEVTAGKLLPENTSLQEIRSGLKPGQQVVSNALVLDHTLGQ